MSSCHEDQEDEDVVMATQTQSFTDDPSTQSSRLEYWWLILFQWNINVENPFQIFVKHSLKNSGIPISWIEGSLSKSVRRKQIKISVLGGSKYSLFCKVEKGKNFGRKKASIGKKNYFIYRDRVVT